MQIAKRKPAVVVVLGNAAARAAPQATITVLMTALGAWRQPNGLGGSYEQLVAKQIELLEEIQPAPLHLGEAVSGLSQSRIGTRRDAYEAFLVLGRS